METNSLTPEQRDVLIFQINRRMAKWPDEALARMEELTRVPLVMDESPADARPISPSRPVLSEVEPIPAQLPAGAVENGRKFSRREALVAGAGGVMTLLAAASGGGLYMSTDKLGDIRALAEPFANSLLSFQIQSAIQAFTAQLDTLRAACDANCREKDTRDQAVVFYQMDMGSMTYAISELRGITNELDTILQSLKDVEALKDMDLTKLASLVFTLGDKANFLILYLTKMPYLIQASLNLLAQMDRWFSEQSNIDAQLLRPLHEVLFPAIDEIQTQVGSIQQTWESQLAGQIPRILENMGQIHDAADG